MMERPVSIEFETSSEEESDSGETSAATERVRIDAPSWSALCDAVRTSAVDGVKLRDDRLTSDGGLTGCLVCGHIELYQQRDFPRSLGLVIVVGAALLAPFTNYLSLMVAALLDLVLYQVSRRMFVCYVCTARHRGFLEVPRHPSFDREIAERLQFGERAVMGKPMRPGGTAGAPEPEH